MQSFYETVPFCTENAGQGIDIDLIYRNEMLGRWKSDKHV